MCALRRELALLALESLRRAGYGRSTTMRLPFFLSGLTLLSCAPSAAPGMALAVRHADRGDPGWEEVARAEPARDARSLLVVHKREACSGSAAAVLLGRNGRFYGSVAAGEAALLTVPEGLTQLEVVSTVEITAPLRSWFVSDVVAIPPLPDGLLITPRRVSARECWGTGQYTNARRASKADLETVIGDSDITWLEPRVADGQRWLERHRARLDEILEARAERCPSSPLLAPSYCPEANGPLDAFVPPR